MKLVRNRPIRLPAAVLVAALAVSVSAAAGLAQTKPEESWQLRAQVRPRGGASLSGPRTLPDAIVQLHQAACRRAAELLADGEPGQARVQLALWRQPGPADATSTESPDMSCHVQPGRISAFRLRSRVAGATGWVEAGQGLHRLAELANNMASKVMATGEKVWITLRLGAREKPVRGMIRSLARRHQVSVSTALTVAGCESHFNPRAYSHPYAGVYQQHVGYWPGRARRFGHRGASPFDPYANVEVSLRMARATGWGHWGCG